MECHIETPRLEVETADTIYEIEFGQVQVGITGRCNMSCQHCRAALQPKNHMPADQVLKVIRFARQFSPPSKEIVLSGGEPLTHPDFVQILTMVRESGGDFVTLTTNGSLFTAEHLQLLKELSFERFMLSISLDSLDPAQHDAFRRHKGAFQAATRALRRAVDADVPGVIVSIRSTIRADQIGEMEGMVEYARSVGCQRISFSDVHPAGKAIKRRDLWMTGAQKRTFIEEIYRLKMMFPGLNVITNDPLKCLLRGKNDVGQAGEIIFDGCGAAAITFNVNADGTMTPCSLLDIPMMNVLPLTIVEITEAYRNCPVVKDMLAMNLKGKCGACPSRYQCGGCRARAHVQLGDYLAEDPHCWM